VKGRILTVGRRGVVLVPRSALSSWDAAARKGNVFVLDNAVARLRPVTTGSVQGEAVEIPSGLTQGETVVTRGAFNLRDGDAVKVVRVEGE
jgi:multidrug efflux pump subunit AcrA (membrane-fusion protein)